jgi:predicted transcriptional regulator
MGKEKYMSIRLPQDLKKKIQEQAEKNRRSMVSEIQVLVERGLEFSKAK